MKTFLLILGFVLSQNIPNPFHGTTSVYLASEEAGEVTMVVADVYGQLEAQLSEPIEIGVHQFDIQLCSKGTYVLGAHMNGKSSSIVLFCEEGGRTNRIEYAGMVDEWKDDVYQNINAEDSEEEFVGYAEISRQHSVISSQPFRVALSLSPFTLNHLIGNIFICK